MYLLVISHEKSSVHCHESFQINSGQFIRQTSFVCEAANNPLYVYKTERTHNSQERMDKCVTSTNKLPILSNW